MFELLPHLISTVGQCPMTSRIGFSLIDLKFKSYHIPFGLILKGLILESFRIAFTADEIRADVF